MNGKKYKAIVKQIPSKEIFRDSSQVLQNSKTGVFI